MSEPALAKVSRRPALADLVPARALRLVPTRPAPAARVPFVLLVSAVLIGGVIGLLMFNTSMQQASFTAAALEREARALSAREQTLQMELDVLRDPQRVAEQAQAMGLVPVVRPAFLDLSDSSIRGIASAATAADGVRIRPLQPAKPAILAPAPVVTTVTAPAESTDTRAGSADEERARDKKKQNQDQKNRQRG